MAFSLFHVVSFLSVAFKTHNTVPATPHYDSNAIIEIGVSDLRVVRALPDRFQIAHRLD